MTCILYFFIFKTVVFKISKTIILWALDYFLNKVNDSLLYLNWRLLQGIVKKEISVDEKIYKSKIWFWISLVIPYFILCVALLVLLGWFLKSLSLVCLLDSIPMQFNTALCVLLCALGLIALARQRFVLSKILALLSTLISLITFAASHGEPKARASSPW